MQRASVDDRHHEGNSNTTTGYIGGAQKMQDRGITNDDGRRTNIGATLG